MINRGLQLLWCFFILISCDNEKTLDLWENGKLKAKWYYKNDTLNGRKEVYLWPNGSKSEIFHYRDGKLHGEYFALYENGQIARKGNYIEGKRVGPYYRYFRDEDGKVQSESYFIFANGLQYIFYTKHFNKDGKLVRYDGNIVLTRTNNKDLVELQFVGSAKYDSMQVICGAFTSEFNVRQPNLLDTFYFKGNLVRIPLNKMKDQKEDYVRAIFKAYRSESIGDSIQIHEHTDFIEQLVDSLQ